MEILIAQLINGLALGSIYAMLVVAFNLLLLVKGVFHYSLIHITVVTMFVCWLILDLTGSLAWAIPVSIISAIILNILTEPLFRPLVKRKAVIETMCLSMGVAMVFTEIMSHQINNGVPIGFPSGIVGGGGSLQVGLIYFSLANIYTIIACLVAVFIFYYFLFRHKEGRALRAIAQNLSVARILGISLNRAGVYTFAIAGLFAGIIGILLIMTLGAASASLGDTLAMKVIIVVMFAGTGNLKGGIIAALIVAVVEALSSAFLPGRWTQAMVYGVIMVVIIARPQGVFGAKA